MAARKSDEPEQGLVHDRADDDAAPVRDALSRRVAPDEPATRTAGDPAPAPAPILPSGSKRSAIKPDVLYRPARGGAVRVTHADGSHSYHGGATLLRFAEPPKEIDGDLEEALSGDDYAAVAGLLPADRRMPGKPKDDPVEAFSFADLQLARMSTQAMLARRARVR